MKKGSYVLRLLITAGLLVFVLKKTGIFDSAVRIELFEMICAMSVPFLLASLLVSILINLSSAYKWFLLLKSRALSVSFFRSWALYMVGIFFSLMLPTSMGGDVIRIYELGKQTGSRAMVAASVFVERFTGMVVLFILALFAFFFRGVSLSVTWLGVSVCVALILSGLMIWVLIDQRPYKILTSVVLKRISFLSGVLMKIDRFHGAVIEYRDDKQALFVALVNTLLFYFLAVVNVYVTASAFSVDINFTELLAAVPLIMFIMNLPVSIGGIGLMEFSFVIVFESFGYSPGVALSTALLMRVKSLFDAAMGGLLYLQLLKRDASNS